MRSMTGFGTGQASGEPGDVVVEIRSVNSRYLDLQFRLPDELRQAEMPMREQLSRALARGKVEVRASYTRTQPRLDQQFPTQRLTEIESIYRHIQRYVPDVSPPSLTDITQWPDPNKSLNDVSQWTPLCLAATQAAIEELIEVRSREGARLAQIIEAQAQAVQSLVSALRARLPELLRAQSERVAMRLKDALTQAFPNGLEHISGQEIAERLTTEASVIALKADVAEELDRLVTHVQELEGLIGLSDAAPSKETTQETTQETTKGPKPSSLAKQGQGKRLDFLFQEMNREANTLGSKSVNGEITQAAIELKLLIEQMREQIQNIE